MTNTATLNTSDNRERQTERGRGAVLSIYVAHEFKVIDVCAYLEHGVKKNSVLFTYNSRSQKTAFFLIGKDKNKDIK